ncbi:MAG: Ig-like domain repeat protein [Methanosphaera sp.]|nr:Ig-like domain repeat protein [Methanosphaera sp.]
MIKNNRKTLSMLALLLLTFVLIGAVSATDAVADDTSDSIADTSASDYSDNLQADDNYKSIEKIDDKTSPKGAYQTVQASDYSELKGYVQDAKDNEDDSLSYIISLSQSGTYTVDETIKWRGANANPELTIEGNGATITGAGLQFLTVGKVNTLTINNVIIDGTSAEKGGAINSNGTLIITNSIIRNSNANYGGAIFSTGTLTLENVTFESNHAAIGGAIYSNGTLTANNVTFKENIAQNDTVNNIKPSGGAIYSNGTATVTASNFTANRIISGVNGDEGAGIYTTTALYVYDSIFDGNIGEYTDTSSSSNGANGGAIAVINSISDFIVNNSTFTNNKGRHGGAILIDDEQGRNQGTKKITKSTFTGNQAIYGGAIEMYNDLVIEDSIFEGNLVYGVGSGGISPKGGAICVNNLTATDECSLSVKNTTFERNSAPQTTVSGTTIRGEGGAIYNSGITTIIDNCTFTENSAYQGGAYYCNDKDRSTARYASINNTKFEDNVAYSGAAIYDQHSNYYCTLIINQSVFEDNNPTSTVGYGIYARYDNLTMTNTEISGLKPISVDTGGLSKYANNLTVNGLKNVTGISVGDLVVSPNNYEELLIISKNINNGYTGVENVNITLVGTEYIETEPIIFDNTTSNKIVFIGNAKTIDANGKQFMTICEVKSVLMRNMTIANAHGDIGGAIINHGTLSTQNKVYFENNTALYYGGAIYNDGNLSVSNTNFTNNNVTTITGAVSHDYGGGAIFTSGKLTVTTSNFTANNAAHNDVEPRGNGGYGGAIQVLNSNKEISIKTSNFKDNTARGGGAINIYNSPNGKKTISQNNFTENSALYGGAIETYESVNITFNNFTSNTAKGQGSGNRTPVGGAITVNPNGNELKANISNNIFTDNSVLDDGRAGAINAEEGTTVVSANNIYSGNSATRAGALNNYGNMTSTNDTYINNEADEGDIVYATSPVRITASTINTENEFGELVATVDPAIVEGFNVIVNGVTYDYTNFRDPMVFDVADYQALVDLVAKIKADQIPVNIVANLVGSEYIETEPIVIDDTFLPETFTIEGNAKTIDASGKQFLTVNAGKSVVINNLTVVNAQADNGAAIINHGDLTVTNSVFNENKALYRGGAIWTDGTLTVNSTKFTANEVTTHQGAGSRDYGGGAICAFGELTVDTCVFSENIAAHNDVEPRGDGGVAGAILVLNDSEDITIINSNFTKNSGRHGGAITINDNLHRNEGTVLIDNNNFTENDALYGGAIDTYHPAIITNNNFTNNYIDGQGSADRVPMGAAICVNNGGEPDYIVTLENNVFSGNEARENGCGGAIYTVPDTTLNSNNNTYENNTAIRYGGAIDNLGTIISTNDSFINNTASYGGAIFNSGTLTSTDTTFAENTADSMGGVIYNYGTLTSTNTTFTENTANEGGVIYNVGTLTSTNDTFTKNTANDTAGVANYGDATFTDGVFEDNTGLKYTGVFTEYSSGSLVIDNCTFANNEGNGYGDMLYAFGDVTIEDSTITCNKDYDLAIVINNAVITANNNEINGVTVDGGLVVTSIDEVENITAVIYEDKTVTVVVKTSDDTIVKKGSVEVLIGDEVISTDCFATNNGFEVTINVDELLEDQVITIKYDDANGLYVPSQITANLTVDKKLATIDANDDTATATVEKTIPFTVTYDDTLLEQGTATLMEVDENGEAVEGGITQTIDLSTAEDMEFTVALSEGIHYFNISYEDDIYQADTIVINVVASKLTAYLAADDGEGYFDEDITVTVSVLDEDDVAVTQGTLRFVDENDDDVIDPITITGEETTATFNYPLAGQYDITVKYEDGKYEAADWDLTITVFTKDATIVTDEFITAYVGDAISITASVEDENEETVTVGKLVLYKDDVPVDDCELTTGTATLTIPAYTVAGEDIYTIKYEGNGNYEVYDAAVTVTVNKVLAVMTVESEFTGLIDEDIAIPVTITIGDTPITQGTISIFENGVQLNSTEVTGETTTITVSYPELGTHTIRISYEDDKYEASDKTVTVTVNKIETTLSVENQTVKVDDEVTITATVVDVNNNPVTTGTVQFKDADGNILKQVSVTDGVAEYSYTASDAIVEEFTVIYKENPKYVGSSTTATVTVNKYETTLTVNSPTVNVDDEVTITATLVDENNNPVTVGRVQFKDGVGNVVKTVNLANGDELVYTYTSSEAGVEEITVTYVGTYKYATDTAVSTVTTNKIDASINTDADEYSNLFGEDVPITITVEDGEGNPITQGTITVYEGNAVIDTLTITGAETVYTANYPGAGVHNLVFSYDNYKYAAEDKEVTVTALAKEAVIVSEDADAFVGDDVVISATVECDGVEVSEGKIIFKNYQGEVLAECDLSEGPATYDYGTINEEFDDIVTIEYVDSDNYYADIATINVGVIKKYADIELSTSEVAIATPITVTARVTYEDELLNHGQIVFTDDEGNVIDTVNVANGIATTTVQYDLSGTYTVNAEFVDDAFDGEESVDITIEQIPVTISISDDQTVAVGDTAIITATITSEDGVVNGGKVVFTKGTTKLAEVDVTEGSASFDYVPTSAGEALITAKYLPSAMYIIDEDTASCTVTANKIETTTTLDSVSLVAGKTVTLTARITAADDSIVNVGKVAFKINGKTLKDESGKVIYAKVVDGVATLDYEVPSSLLGKDVTIEAVYSGSAKYVNSKDKDEGLSVLSGVANIEITSSATVAKGESATFSVKVTDNNVNVNEGKVVFKINGKTLKDDNGKVIYATVENGVASINYPIPESMKSKDYTLTAVFVSSNYERCEANQTITVQ